MLRCNAALFRAADGWLAGGFGETRGPKIAGAGGPARFEVSGEIRSQVGRFRTDGVLVMFSEELRVRLNLVFRRRRPQRQYIPSGRRLRPRRRWLLRPGRRPGRGYGIRRPGAEESGAICPKIGRPRPCGGGRVTHPISGESGKLGRKFRRQLLSKATRRSAEFFLRRRQPHGGEFWPRPATGTRASGRRFWGGLFTYLGPLGGTYNEEIRKSGFRDFRGN